MAISEVQRRTDHRKETIWREMRKKTREQLEREQRLCEKRTRKRLQRQRKIHPRRQRAGVSYPKAKDSAVILRAPEVFSLEKDPDRRLLLRFLRRLRENVLTEHKDVRVSFVDTQRMIAHGMLLFTAELRRIIRLAGGRNRITCSYPENNKVEQVLQQIGIFELLNKPERLVPDAEDVIHWRFIDGAHAEGEKANELIEAFADKLPESLTKGLYNGLVEAMTNCVHHAYIEPRGDGATTELEHGWWMFAQERETRLMVAFCDLGIGIPRSLPRTQDPTLLTATLEKIARVVKVRGFRDADLIAAALEVGKTRTAKSHRGFGLTEFKEVVEKANEGSLRIFSNRACYTFALAIDDEPIEVRDEFDESIFGTLIQWSLPLGKKA